MIDRLLAPKILDLVKKFPIISLTGPRQSGKTTLLKNLLPNYRYVSLENPTTRTFAKEDPNSFLKTYDQFVVFDEVQRVPELFSYLQTKVDEDQIMGQYVLSGSQNFLLLQNITQSLAGRVAILKLLPLSYAELSKANLLSESIAYHIFTGNYPAIFGRGLLPDEFYSNYIETYVQRDVRELLAVKELSSFQTFLRLCAGRVGQPLNLSSLATDCGITSPTAKAWLSILESSYITFTLQPHYQNFNKRLIKSPKLYFYDTGLLCHLLNMTDARQVETYYQRGSLFENAIIADMSKNRFNRGVSPQFYFWQDSNRNEIDLLEEGVGTINLFEMKYTATINPEHFRNLRLYRELSSIGGDNFLIYAGEENQIRSNAKVIPWNQVINL
ncbi:ATP-binding protein [Runella aurantiaca]|uniref:ATP-binding protein n=1 Tax=Runella aurantiaca TaxID=2282308 RepID=A0A369ICW0_9BACT|nr:ATP-binding protein [Runella aurantiaca]RDB06882.1 ATP-binding protein [Runella aurantiaca]